MKKVHNDSSAAPPLRSTLKGIRRAALVILTALVTANADAQPALSPSDAAKKGRTFLTISHHLLVGITLSAASN